MTPRPGPITTWLFWIVVAAVVYSFVPDGQKIGYLFIIVIGALLFAAKQGIVAGWIDQFSSMQSFLIAHQGASNQGQGTGQ